MGIREAVELQLVNVANANHSNIRVIRPEQVQAGNSSKVDQIWWRSNEILLCCSKPELEEMNGHENQQQRSSQKQAKFVDALAYILHQVHDAGFRCRKLI